jgi:hypothetical protein
MPLRNEVFMAEKNSKDYLVRVFEAANVSEAMVVRGLLQSAGISAPDFEAAEPFPMHEPPEGWHDAEVWVPQSQADDARRILAEYSGKAPASSE